MANKKIQYYTQSCLMLVCIFFSNMVSAQRVGINTSSPTTTLDVNGPIRIRGGSPAAGKVLQATDANGNDVWADANGGLPKVAFSAYGAAAGGASNIPGNGVFYRIPFAVTIYNWGNHYIGWTGQTGYNIFHVPVSGIYHFDVQVDWKYSADGYAGTSIKLVRLRNGVKSDLMTNYQNFMTGTIAFNQISCDVLLQVNDQVFVEGNHQKSGASREFDNSVNTYFNGRLVMVQ